MSCLRTGIFNVADMSLICGVVLAIGLEFTGRQRDGTRVRAKRAGEAKTAGEPKRVEEE